ncbi:MAG: hypothetical protein AB7U41_06710 [Dongiaceae bacterium]
MTDPIDRNPNSVVERSDEEDFFKSNAGEKAGRSEHNLWDEAAEIFKNLEMEMPREGQPVENKIPAAEGSFDDNFTFDRPTPQPRRRSVVGPPPARAQVVRANPRARAGAPRVMWQPIHGAFAPLIKKVQKLVNFTEWTAAGLTIAALWIAMLAVVGRYASIHVFNFDPWEIANWQNIYRDFERGATLEWPFVLGYFLLLAVMIVGAIMWAIRLSPGIKKYYKFLWWPITLPIGFVKRFAFAWKEAVKAAKAAMEPPVEPEPAPQAFEPPPFDETGGSLGGGSSGGGHGRSSWKMGPANNQAFPIELQANANNFRR